MKKNEFLEFKPYSSVIMDIKNFAEDSEVLEKILISDMKISPRLIDKQIILYGAGSLGKMAKNFFDYLNIPFLYFVDKNSDLLKSDADWSGIDIVKPNEVKEEDKKNCLLIVCAVTTPLIALRDSLKADGFMDIAFFYDVCEAYSASYPLTNGWFLHKPSDNEIANIKKVFSLFGDSKSRAHFLQFIAWRRLRVELRFENIELDNSRFFIPEVLNCLSETEVFVDCGAHIGEVTKEFVGVTKGKYTEIYAIEPDKDTFSVLVGGHKNIKNATALQCALGANNGEGHFYQGFGYASKLDERGNETVITTTLDSLHIPATFIKMHLEGGELDALIGALETIKTQRPILAVTIYHNSDGVFKIPLYLMNCTERYSYYLRLDSWGGTGAVFYAVPNERKPLVSICVPNYNNAKYLEQTIKSALDQTYSNIEVIFVDDKSTDNSVRIASKYDDKIEIYINSKNLGQPKNTNKCIALSSGKYLVILHSDDLLLPTFAENLVPILEKNPNVGMAVGEAFRTDENNNNTELAPFYNTDCIIPGIKQAKVFMMASFLSCQVLVRREVIDAIGGVDERHIVNLDGLLWFKCALVCDVAYIQDAVAIYRIHSEQTTAQYNQTLNHMMEYYVTLTEMFRLAKNEPYLEQYFSTAVKRVAELTLRYSRNAIKHRNFTLLSSYLALATVFNPEITNTRKYKLIKQFIEHKDIYIEDEWEPRNFSWPPPESAETK